MTQQEKRFIECCVSGDLRGVKQCYSFEVDIQCEDNWGISAAAMYNNWNIVQFLYSRGIPPQVILEKNIIDYAAYNFQNEIAIQLYESDSIFQGSKSGLNWSAQAGNKDLFEYFITRSDNLGGITADACKGENKEILQLLIDNGIAQNDISSRAGILNLAKKKKWELIELLIENDVQSEDTLKEKQKLDFNKWKSEKG